MAATRYANSPITEPSVQDKTAGAEEDKADLIADPVPAYPASNIADWTNVFPVERNQQQNIIEFPNKE